VIAEQGVGKSRLSTNSKASSQSGWLVLEATSVSHGKATAYLPVIDLLHEYFAIEPNDDTRRRGFGLKGGSVTAVTFLIWCRSFSSIWGYSGERHARQTSALGHRLTT
jgi:hypothetical protein